MRRVPGWGWAWLALGVAMSAALAAPAVRLPSDDVGLRAFQTPDIAADTAISQTFLMTADNLHAIEVSARGTGRASGRVRLELYDVTRGTPLVRSAEVPAVDMVKASIYRFEFSPIQDSAGHLYQLDVSGSEQNPPYGLALVATKGQRYAHGTMLINGAERWADLSFRALSPEGRSGISRLVSLEGPGFARGHVVLVCIAVYWFLSGILLRTLWPVSSRPLTGSVASPDVPVD